MEVLDDNEPYGLEQARSLCAWLCLSIFTSTFVGLLGLSSTVYWTPDNPWIVFFDRAWRISGVVGIVLWAIPHLMSGFRSIRGSSETDA